MNGSTQDEFGALVKVVAALRAPDGCPWDREQNHKSLRKYFVEETYEAIEAIDQESPEMLKEELGDVLLQVLLHAQIDSEQGLYNIDDVCRGIKNKLIRRHPHVFADTDVEGVDDVLHNWEEIKSREPGHREITSAIGGVPESLPALMRATKISKRAARTGFEWPDVHAVIEKLHEEVAELEEAIDSEDEACIKHEIGDLLFTVVNISRWMKVDAEEALREMLGRFRKRFEAIEETAESMGRSINDLSIDEMDHIWNRAKEK